MGSSSPTAPLLPTFTLVNWEGTPSHWQGGDWSLFCLTQNIQILTKPNFCMRVKQLKLNQIMF